MAVHVDSSIRVQAAFYYEVEIDGSVISFQEVSGLTLKNQVIEYRHSNHTSFTKEVRIGLTDLPEITMKKGVFEGDFFLMELFARTWDKAYMSHTDQNFDVTIRLLDETAAVICQWVATGCVVTSMEGPSLKSDDNSAAIESMAIKVNTFEYQPG
jgi:phage tail-like protein